MDVEDPMNPLADDAAFEFAQIFTELGLRGSFCITGEKCRTLLQRDRHDVLEAYRPHCLGLHTDTHSYHPTTMELLADCGYEEGCQAALQTETKGARSFETAFGRKPAFWGGAGNTWSPEVTFALTHLGIPAYSYALTALPGAPIHRFNGVIALPQHLSIHESEWADDEQAKEKSAQILRTIQDHPQPWVGVFVGHPTRFRHIDYWDLAYGNGQTPPTPVSTPATDEATYQRSKANLRSFLTRLQDQCLVAGLDEVLDLPWGFRPPTDAEFEAAAAKTAQNIASAAKWPIHRADLAADRIIAKTLALAHTFEVGELAD